MTEASQKAYDAMQAALDKESKSLRGADYYDFLSEFHAHLRSLMDCYEEEHPEDFA